MLETFNKKSSQISRHMNNVKARGVIEGNISLIPQSDPSDKGKDTSHNNQVIYNPESYSDPMAGSTYTGSAQAHENSESQQDSISNLLRAVTEAFHISDNSFKLLFPALVPAFSLSNKSWWWLVADNLEEVTWNTAAFKTLQLDHGTKDLIQSLVRGHRHGSVMFDDVMAGKGQGLVFLFHGEPGLGKTLTAESVAEELKRPLYSISGGELSTDVAVLEKRLNVIFDLAKRWNAVSLLDEADVLLCKRTSAEMDRNAIVAGKLLDEPLQKATTIED
ncbi:putative P-loop containing nucleoside triphosphate hydrolase protein [Rosellinia necatrix]|uniref:Putative P-loop containing nucleoside triphosphate hydrolase protein n=1 Tax=Rosellinia necatrix TaxID=77044 RepID=A0A1W2TQ88_ROSNE|nr:putative P-loop containing nucleoside triphosphate hydrolase protein [Rosellinia necatrix]